LYLIYKTVAVCFLVFILFISFTGFLSHPETSLSCTTVIESPKAIVWQYLTNSEKIVQWRKDISKVEILNMQGMKYGGVLKYYQNNTEYQERIIEWIPEKKICLQRLEDINYPLLDNILTMIEIKALVDGSTEINIILKYNVKSFFSRIYNKIYLRGYFTDQYEKHLLVLKNILEKV
jgi:uncharacterized membrane protein